MNQTSDRGNAFKPQHLCERLEENWSAYQSNGHSLNASFVTALILSEVVSHQLLQPKTQVLVAMSGGQDSTVLAFVLFQLEYQWQLQLQGLYHNHGSQVDNFYMGWHSLRYIFYLHWSGIYTLSFHPLNSEDEGWRWRTEFRARLSVKKRLHHVVLGHTQTDIAESALLHLLREHHQLDTPLLPWSATTLIDINPDKAPSSLFYSPALRCETLAVRNQSPSQSILLKRCTQKICGQSASLMKSKKDIARMTSLKLENNHKENYRSCSLRDRQILRHVLASPKTAVLNSSSDGEGQAQVCVVRPLLGLSRTDVHFLCAYWNLPLYSDQTNAMMQNTRAQLRYCIFPMFETLGFSNPTKHLALSMEAQQEDAMFLQSIVQKLQGIEDVVSFRGLPSAIQKRVTSWQLKCLSPKGFMRRFSWSCMERHTNQSLGVYWPGKGSYLNRQFFGLTGTRTQN